MKIIKTFERFNDVDLLMPEFEKYLPKNIHIIKKINNTTIERDFSIGNIMRNANMTQIIYTADNPIFGHPDEMSIDFYYYKNGNIKLSFDIIYGDFVSCSFSIEPPKKVKIIEYTSYGSKFDPSNTVFAISGENILDMCKFINKIDGFNVNADDFNFLKF